MSLNVHYLTKAARMENSGSLSRLKAGLPHSPSLGGSSNKSLTYESLTSLACNAVVHMMSLSRSALTYAAVSVVSSVHRLSVRID